MKRDADNEWLHVAGCDDADRTGCSDAAEMEQMRDERLTLRARITALESAQQWQPIATVPKDGTRVLMYCGRQRGRFAIGRNYADRIPVDDDSYTIVNATHWMPLPAAPKETP